MISEIPGIPETAPVSGGQPGHRERPEVLALKLNTNRTIANPGTSMQGLARALTECGILTPRGSGIWTHTTVGRLLARTDTQTIQAADPFPLPA